MQRVNNSDSGAGHGSGHADRDRLLSLLLSADRERREAARTICPRGKWDGHIPLSYAQERLWFLDQLGLVGASYNVPRALRLEGNLNVEALEHSFSELAHRHEVLRTSFGAQDGVPHQLIDASGHFKINRADLSHVADHQRREEQLLECMLREQLHRFDLREGTALRVMLVKLDDREHALLLTLHHIVADGWSSSMLVQELSALYAAHMRGQPSPLPKLSVQYADYAIWQRQWLQGEVLQEQLKYWRKQLLGAPPALELPTDRPRPAVESYKGAMVRFEFPTTLSAALRELGRQAGATLFMVSLAAYLVLLSRWSGQQEIVIGSPIAGRRNREIEGVIGCFVNTLALRANVSGGLTFRQLLERVKEVTIEAYAHQDVPFEALVKELRPERNLTRQPIFQVTLSMQNYPEERLDLPGITWTWIDVEWVHTHFDLTLHLYEHSHGLSGAFGYATDLFDKETIGWVVEHFRTLMGGIATDPDCPIDQLPLISEAEKQWLLVRWNQATGKYPRERSMHGLFEDQVERTPDATAVVYEGQSLTYAELNAGANRLASYLKDRGVGVDQLVALFVERSVEMVVGLLGILKAGGAYVPLDPNYPIDRLQYVLRDARPGIVLTQQRLKAIVPKTTATVIALDGVKGEIARISSDGLDRDGHTAQSQRLAYVIYTSGSTGLPKGAMIEHASVIDLWQRLEDVYGERTSCPHIALNAPFSFDASVKQIVQLLSGRTIFVVAEDDRRDGAAMLAFIEKHDIRGIDCTPSQLKSWIAAGLLDNERCPLRTVLVGGEAIEPQLWNTLARCSRIDFHNVYGPTECTVDATIAYVNGDTTAPHIGRPMENRSVYILDGHRELAPIGVAGGIYIGGAGVGRGYLNRPDLTAERFVPDPFAADRQARMYRTGDVGRWRPDGRIEYLGRDDHQVKIRGFRIELGEIEAQLVRHAQVKEAVVIAREDVPGEKRLVAYVVQRESTPNVEDLRAHLADALPKYMVPTAFVNLESLPLTPNGKLDRRALPMPELSAYLTRQYEAPQGEVEQTLAEIWRELLHVERVGRHDNFFELGGHSLLGMKLIAKVAGRLMVRLSAVAIFQHPTVQQMAKAAESMRSVTLAGCEAMGFDDGVI